MNLKCTIKDILYHTLCRLQTPHVLSPFSGWGIACLNDLIAMLTGLFILLVETPKLDTLNSKGQTK